LSAGSSDVIDDMSVDRAIRRAVRSTVGVSHAANDAMPGMLVLDRERDHRRIERQHAGVIGGEQHRAFGGHVLEALDLDAPVIL